MAAVDATTPLLFRRQALFWPLQVGGWAGYLTLAYLVAIAHGKATTYWMVPLAVAATGFVGTLGLRYLLHAVGGRSPREMIAAVALPVLLVSALMGTAHQLVVIDFCESCRPTSAMSYFAYALSHIYVVLAWVGLYVGITYYRRLQEESRRVLAANAMAHQAQLKMLRYQLNPHFLFNTLNAISTLILDRDGSTANRMVQGLSAFLRHSLDNDPMQRVTLKQELEALNLYLGIEKVRFAERLRMQTEVEPECWSALVPSLILQPLVENAIKYAVAPRVEGGAIRISAQRSDDSLVLCVSDDGPGCPAMQGGRLPAGNGVGLRNARDRLRVLYGERAGFDVDSPPEGGLVIALSLPFETGTLRRE